MTEPDKLHRAIAALEDQQLSLGLDFTQQIAELRRRLAEEETSPQSGSSGAATPGGTAAPWVYMSLAIFTTSISLHQGLGISDHSLTRQATA